LGGRGTARNELEEATGRAVPDRLLMKEGEFSLVKDLEELIPGRLFEFLVFLAEVEAENAASSSRGTHNGGPPAAFFGPAPDFVMISGRGGLAHGLSPGKLKFTVSTS
jgi:hypothetical protein